MGAASAVPVAASGVPDAGKPSVRVFISGFTFVLLWRFPSSCSTRLQLLLSAELREALSRGSRV